MADEFKFNFEENLKSKRRQTPEGQRKRNRQQIIKPKLWLFPFAEERSYRNIIKKNSITPIWNIASPVLQQNLTEWVRQVKQDSTEIQNNFILRFDNLIFDELTDNYVDIETKSLDWIYDFKKVDSVRNDIFPDDLNEMVRKMNIEINKIFGANTDDPASTNIWPIIVSVGIGVLIFNGKQWKKQTEQVLGFEFQTDESWWPGVRDRWAQENYRLMRNVSDDFTSRMNEIVSRGVREGKSTKEIRDELQRLLNITKNRANLIARDQVGKLNGEITKNRMQEAGINIYIWRTAKDERVRPTHKNMEGMLNRWDNNNVFADPETDVIRKNGNIIKINWRSRTSSMPIGAIPGSEINCFLGGTPVRSPVPAQKLYRRRFTGKTAKFIMEDGSSFVCTLNHPILSVNGRWIAAKNLKMGDNVVNVPNNRLNSLVETNKENSIAAFDKLFSFFSIIEPIKRITKRADFHGDGIINKNVDIISFEGKLTETVKSSISKGLYDFFFTSANMSLSFLPCDRNFLSMCSILGFPFNGGVRFLSKLFPLFKGHSGILNELRFRTTTELNSIFFEDSCNNITRAIELFGEVGEKFTVDIFSNYDFFRQLFFIISMSFVLNNSVASFSDSSGKIVSLDSKNPCDLSKIFTTNHKGVRIVDKIVSQYSGYVYNLQNSLGWYIITDKNIIVKNCRCTAIPYWEPVLQNADEKIAA